ncbi:MAG TPA: putative quinol monooxygenase [Terracidiphilus sp.]|nr:putative quinol monooxygenase [Terracidiphilus sp.]
MRFAQEDRIEIDDILRELTRASREEPGCMSYIPHRMQEDPDTVLIYEQYADQKAEEAHRQTAHFRKYAVGGLFQKMLDRNREDLIAVA